MVIAHFARFCKFRITDFIPFFFVFGIIPQKTGLFPEKVYAFPSKSRLTPSLSAEKEPGSRRTPSSCQTGLTANRKRIFFSSSR